MIYSTRPVTEGHKTVLAVKDKPLDKSLNGRESKNDNTKLNNATKQNQKQTPNNGVIDKEKLEKAVEETNRIVFPSEDKFEFKIHEGTGRIMVKLVNKETEEIIREIPSEKILDLIANIWEMVGIVVDERG
jgi:flagellar protein FlaG